MSDTPATFTAYDVPVDGGAKVSITASSLEQFLTTLSKLGVGVNGAAKDTPAASQPKRTTTTEKPKAETTAAEAQSSAASADAVSAAKPPADASPTKAAGAEPMPYEQLQKVVFALAGKDRQAVVDLMAQFGVSHFKTLAAERIAEAHAVVSAKLAELEVA